MSQLRGFEVPSYLSVLVPYILSSEYPLRAGPAKIVQFDEVNAGENTFYNYHHASEHPSSEVPV